MDPRRRFSDTVDDYRRYRPDYPEALLDWVLVDARLAPGDVVIDVGCGTGISARQLASRGLTVVGVDPNEAMLAAAREEGGGPRYVRSDGESLEIGLERCDAVVGGQSFHWLDLPRARLRFRELLRPEGRVVAFWNLRDGRDPFMARYEALLLRWSPEYADVGAEPRAEAVARSVGEHRRETFAHHQRLDRAGFRGRVWSSSYIRNVVEDREALDRELDALFDAHAADGFVRFVYRTLALGFDP